MTCPTRKSATPASFPTRRSRAARFPHLCDRPRRRADLRRVQRLDRVDHAHVGPLALERRADASRSSRPGSRPAPRRRVCCPQLDLGGDPRRSRAARAGRGDRGKRHQKQRRLADPRLATDQDEQGRDEPAPEHAIGLRDAGAAAIDPSTSTSAEAQERLRLLSSRPQRAEPPRPRRPELPQPGSAQPAARRWRQARNQRALAFAVAIESQDAVQRRLCQVQNESPPLRSEAGTSSGSLLDLRPGCCGPLRPRVPRRGEILTPGLFFPRAGRGRRGHRVPSSPCSEPRRSCRFLRSSSHRSLRSPFSGR